MSLSARILVRLTVVALVAALLPAVATPHPASADADCAVSPAVNLTFPTDLSASHTYFEKPFVLVGKDRVYVEDIDATNGTVNSVDTRMYSFDGTFLGSIQDFVIFQVDSTGSLWGSVYDGPGQWRTATGQNARPLQDVYDFLHEFGDYRWGFVRGSSGSTASFKVYTEDGDFLTTVDDVSPRPSRESNNFLDSGFHPVATSWGPLVAVTKRAGLQDWIALYEPDGTFIRDVPPPPGATEYNSQGALLTGAGLYVWDPAYSGSDLLYFYARSGDYVGEVNASGLTGLGGIGEWPSAPNPAIAVEGFGFWSTNTGVVRLAGSSAVPLTGLSPNWPLAIYSTGSQVHVIHTDGSATFDRAFGSGGSPLSSSELYQVDAVMTAPTHSVVVGEISNHLEGVIIDEFGRTAGTIVVPTPSGMNPGLFGFDMRGTVMASAGPTNLDFDATWLRIWNVDECQVSYTGKFSDDDNSVFENAIEKLAAAGITQGCNPPINDRFCPADFVTRGEMAVFLARALGYTDDGGEDFFVDDDGKFYENAANKIRFEGVTQGCNPPANDEYCGDKLVTREQMAAFLVRALGLTDDGGGDLFVDDDTSIFEGAIDKLGTAGITQGCNPPENDKFCPKDFVTRGQLAAFLVRAGLTD